MTIHALIIV